MKAGGEDLLAEVLEAFFLILAGLMIAYLVRHYIFTITVLKNHQKPKRVNTAENITFQPTISVLIPAHNEEKVVGRTIQRMTELTYPKDKLQIIIIEDASTDKTGAIADQYAAMHNHIKVIHRDRKVGGRGKASALNAGLKRAAGEIIVCFDADYYPQPDFLERITKEFVNPKVGVVQGRITVLNEPYNIVTRLVALERIGGYRIDQQARDNLGLITQFGGTAGGIRRSLLESLGGWNESILAEDTDLTLRVYLAGYKVSYLNEAESYEEAVESWQAYWKQRYRWAKGHMQWCSFLKKTIVLRSSCAKGLFSCCALCSAWCRAWLSCVSRSPI